MQRTFEESIDEGTTKYTVLSVEKTAKVFTVTGLTVKGGPTFKATLRPQKKIELFDNGQIIQTDRCR